MKRLLVATGNPGKISELSALFDGEVDIVSLAEAGLDSPEETGATFVENAVLKATSAARESGLIAVADDSGIEVDALGGAPGVRSARYAGDAATDEANRALLLRELEHVSERGRTARFVCAIAAATPDGRYEVFHGTLEGVITREPRGSGGFGYDPVMRLEDGRTVAELSADEKNRISHRGIALRNALPYLRDLLESVPTDWKDMR
jgi:XTP/dITP diphosphohydrolase